MLALGRHQSTALVEVAEMTRSGLGDLAVARSLSLSLSLSLSSLLFRDVIHCLTDANGRTPRSESERVSLGEKMPGSEERYLIVS